MSCPRFLKFETYLNTGGADDFFFVHAISSGDRYTTICNRKSGVRFDVENEFIRPFIESPRQITHINVNSIDEYSYLITVPARANLKGTKIQRYIEWGEEEAFNLASGRKGKNKWYVLPKQAYEGAKLLWPCRQNNKHFVVYNESQIVSHRFYRLNPRKKNNDWKFYAAILNSTWVALLPDILRPAALGQGVLDISGLTLKSVLIPKKDLFSSQQMEEIKSIFEQIMNRQIRTLYEECGIDPKSDIPIAEQEPKPLPDRAALDKIVFDALGLTEDERKQVYRAVCQLVWNRLSKAKSLKRS